MSEHLEHEQEQGEEGPSHKVVDRRRFGSDGNPRTDAASSPKSAPQPEVSAEERATDAAEVDRLSQELEAARKRIDELARAYQALDRDREEFKARLGRERDRMLDVERGKVALLVVEAIDELDLCLAGADDSPVVRGVRLIRDNLLRKLEQAGIERLDPVGQPFNPQWSEAADMEITPVAEDDQKVVAVVRAGYRLGDRVVRPAMVKVAKYVEPASA